MAPALLVAALARLGVRLAHRADKPQRAHLAFRAARRERVVPAEVVSADAGSRRPSRLRRQMLSANGVWHCR